MTSPKLVEGVTNVDGKQISFIRENFLKGCYFDEDDEEYKKLEEERTAKMKAEVRECDNWDWKFIEETYEGITMKHVYDMLGQYKEVQYESECPTPYAEPYFKEFVAKGDNQMDKLEPEDGNSMPGHWFDWHRDISCEEYKTLPYKQTVVMDLHHLVAEPVPL